MKQRIFSVALALCLCISSPSMTFADQEDTLPQQEMITEKSTSEPVVYNDGIDSENLTPTGVYEAMIALKDDDRYKEGTTWTDYEPYSDSLGYYRWKGGTLGGTNIVAVGCVAFAFILSDEAFGSLPNRMFAAGEFSYEDIKVGDILRVNNDIHTVIVLEVSEAGVVVAEGNYSGKVHWGRAISKADVMNSASHYITRYPEDYIPSDDPTANDVIADGTIEGRLTWELTKAGTMTIFGNGAMPDFSVTLDGDGNQPWNEYKNQIKKVVIGNGVTSIGSFAFYNYNILTAEISSSVTTIGSSAFYGSSLIYVSIPSSVKTIGDSAFRACQNLSSVTVSEGVETIVQNAFRSCTSLSSVTLPASIEEVGAGAFYQCTAMMNATFTSGSRQVTLGDNLFTGCYWLLSVTLPQNIDRISDGMFENCSMLAGVEIPQGAESIGTQAFASSGVSVVIIPDSVTSIEIAAFLDCPLSEIYFTGTEAQWNSISKSADVTAVVSKATMHYEYTPDTDDGNDNDNNNSSDNNDNNNDGNNDKSGNDESEITFAKGETFTISNATYKVTKAGKEVELTTSKSTKKSVTINTVTGTDGVTYKVTSIGAKAMQNNKKLTSLTIGVNVKTIGKGAFKGCKKLNKITIKSKNLSSVGKQAFKNTKASLKVKVPSKLLKKYKKVLKKGGLKVNQIS